MSTKNESNIKEDPKKINKYEMEDNDSDFDDKKYLDTI